MNEKKPYVFGNTKSVRFRKHEHHYEAMAKAKAEEAGLTITEWIRDTIIEVLESGGSTAAAATQANDEILEAIQNLAAEVKSIRTASTTAADVKELLTNIQILKKKVFSFSEATSNAWNNAIPRIRKDVEVLTKKLDETETNPEATQAILKAVKLLVDKANAESKPLDPVLDRIDLVADRLFHSVAVLLIEMDYTEFVEDSKELKAYDTARKLAKTYHDRERCFPSPK